MKRMLCVILGMLLAVGLFGGCGTVELDADESVVYVNKKGEITFLDVEAFDPGVYDEAELRSFLENEIAAYTDVHGKNTVKLTDLKVENGIAKLKLSCQSAEDFAQYNGIELYQGRVVDALAAGYVFDGEFVKVTAGAAAGSATKQEIYQDSELKVVIIRTDMDVRVEGEICFVSCQNVSLTGADSVSVRAGTYLGGQAAPAVNPTAGVQSGTRGTADEAVTGTESAGVDGDVQDADGQSNTSDGDGQRGTSGGDDRQSGSGTQSADGQDGTDEETDGSEYGMVIDADTSGESAAGAGAYDFNTAPDEAAAEADAYVFIVYR